jgi:hypothetical protein
VRLGLVPTNHFREGLPSPSKWHDLTLGLSPTTKQKPPFLRKGAVGHVSVIRGQGMSFPTADANLRKQRQAATSWI